MLTQSQPLSAARQLADLPQILVVDDDTAVCNLIRMVLEEHGYCVWTAGSGPAAHRVFEARGRELCLLVTDVSLPDMSGPELAAAILAERPELPVLYVSGDLGQHASQLRGLDVLWKPFPISRLLARVDDLVQERANG